MSISIIVDAENQLELATNKGYGDLCRWVESLDADDYLPLAHLCEYGYWDGGGELFDATNNALDNHPPDDDTVASTAARLREIAAKGDAFVVTNGMSRA